MRNFRSARLSDVLADKLPAYLKVHQIFFYLFITYFKHFGRSIFKHLFWKVCVPAAAGLFENIYDSGLYTKLGVFRYACPFGYDIGCFKAYSFNIGCKLIRVIAHKIVYFKFVGIVDLYGHVKGDAVLLQKHHGIAQVLFFGCGLCYLGRLFVAYALYFCKCGRLFFYDAKRILTEFFNDPFGHLHADPFYCSR